MLHICICTLFSMEHLGFILNRISAGNTAFSSTACTWGFMKQQLETTIDCLYHGCSNVFFDHHSDPELKLKVSSRPSGPIPTSHNKVWYNSLLLTFLKTFKSSIAALWSRPFILGKGALHLLHLVEGARYALLQTQFRRRWRRCFVWIGQMKNLQPTPKSQPHVPTGFHFCIDDRPCKSGSDRCEMDNPDVGMCASTGALCPAAGEVRSRPGCRAQTAPTTGCAGCTSQTDERAPPRASPGEMPLCPRRAAGRTTNFGPIQSAVLRGTRLLWAHLRNALDGTASGPPAPAFAAAAALSCFLIESIASAMALARANALLALYSSPGFTSAGPNSLAKRVKPGAPRSQENSPKPALDGSDACGDLAGRCRGDPGAFVLVSSSVSSLPRPGGGAGAGLGAFFAATAFVSALGRALAAWLSFFFSASSASFFARASAAFALGGIAAGFAVAFWDGK